MQQLYAYVYPGLSGKDLTVTDFAATVAAGVKVRERTVLPVALQALTSANLVRVVDAQGYEAKNLTPKQLASGKRQTGLAKQSTCFICKQYRAKYKYTCFQCHSCRTALCNNKYKDPKYATCLAEHLHSNDERLNCNGRKKQRFPKELKEYHKSD